MTGTLLAGQLRPHHLPRSLILFKRSKQRFYYVNDLQMGWGAGRTVVWKFTRSILIAFSCSVSSTLGAGRKTRRSCRASEQPKWDLGYAWGQPPSGTSGDIERKSWMEIRCRRSSPRVIRKVGNP
jgi:hypothetical protein